jgi:hypothetical protein
LTAPAKWPPKGPDDLQLRLLADSHALAEVVGLALDLISVDRAGDSERRSVVKSGQLLSGTGRRHVDSTLTLADPVVQFDAVDRSHRDDDTGTLGGNLTEENSHFIAFRRCD